MSLDGKVAIVSGAGPNIGRQIAATLAENGARLVCLDVKGDAAQATADALTANGFEALAVQADITVPEQVGRAVDQAIETFGAVDILVNNAAITHRAGLAGCRRGQLEKCCGRDPYRNIPLHPARG